MHLPIYRYISTPPQKKIMMFFCHRLFLFIVRVTRYQIDAELVHQLLVIKTIAACRLREFCWVAMLVLLGRFL